MTDDQKKQLAAEIKDGRMEYTMQNIMEGGTSRDNETLRGLYGQIVDEYRLLTQEEFANMVKRAAIQSLQDSIGTGKVGTKKQVLTNMQDLCVNVYQAMTADQFAKLMSETKIEQKIVDEEARAKEIKERTPGF